MPGLNPPVPLREPVVREHHGDRREDPFAWMRTPDERTLAHLRAENAYTEAATAHLAELRAALYSDMLARIQEADLSAPVPHGRFEYATRTEEGKAYAVHVRRLRGGGGEVVVLDENARAEGADYYRLGAMSFSDDQRRMAWTEDRTGRERYTLRVIDLDTGIELCAPIEEVCADVELLADGTAVVYATQDATERPYRAVLHALGGEPEVLHEEPDERFFLGLESTRDGRYVVVTLGSKLTTEAWALDRHGGTSLQLIAGRRQGVELEVAHHRDRWLLLTNAAARDFRVVVSVAGADPSTWTDLVPATPGLYLTGLDAFDDAIVVYARRDGLERMLIVDPGSGAWREVEFDEPAYALSRGDNREAGARVLRLGLASPVTPETDLDVDLRSGAIRVVKRRPVLGGYDSSRFVTERLWATSADGTRVPISIARRRDVPYDGTAPVLLQGYGAYGICYDAAFSVARLSLLERGVVVAIAHVRGGSEMGRAWYERGRLQHKENSFADLIAATEALVAEGVAGPRRVALWGGSAGGLLVGAALNARPDLFGAVLALVPFVDCLSTMLDATLPLTVTEYEEWGNPEEQPDVYARMRRYSPYDNVPDAELPAVMATGGLTDPRVGFWEPSKWVARLRDRQRGGAPILLRMHLGAGHGGPSGRYGQLEEVAHLYAFALDALGAV